MDLKFRYSTIILLIIFFSISIPVFSQEESLNTITTNSIDTTKRKLSFKGYPYAFYTPETKLAFGAGGIMIYYTGKDHILKPSKTSFGGYYSTNNQYRLSMNNIVYFAKNKLYFQLPMMYGYYVDKYWGQGEGTVENGDESYTKKVFSTSLNVQVPPQWFISDRTGIILDYENTQIIDKTNNPNIVDSTTIGSNGSNLFGIGTDLLWDSRDNIFFPSSGGYQYFKLLVYPGTAGQIFSFLELDVRHFRSLGKNMVLAGNFYVASTTGDVPFYRVPGIGGKKMRGYFEGRYRDNFCMLLQLEYRYMFYKRLGFAVFGGVGNVSEDMLSYSVDNIKYNYGGGIRLRFNEEEKVNLRVDVGFGSPGNMGIYFGIEEAF